MQENYIDTFNALTEAYRVSQSELDTLLNRLAKLNRQLKASGTEPVRRVLQAAYDDTEYACGNLVGIAAELEKQIEAINSQAAEQKHQLKSLGAVKEALRDGASVFVQIKQHGVVVGMLSVQMCETTWHGVWPCICTDSVDLPITHFDFGPSKNFFAVI